MNEEKKSGSWEGNRTHDSSNFSKAIGIGVSKGINFNEIEIYNLKSGKPEIKLVGKTKIIVKKIFKKKNINIFLTLSDDEPFAVATVIISLWKKKYTNQS